MKKGMLAGKRDVLMDTSGDENVLKLVEALELCFKVQKI